MDLFKFTQFQITLKWSASTVGDKLGLMPTKYQKCVELWEGGKLSKEMLNQIRKVEIGDIL